MKILTEWILMIIIIFLVCIQFRSCDHWSNNDQNQDHVDTIIQIQTDTIRDTVIREKYISKPLTKIIYYRDSLNLDSVVSIYRDSMFEIRQSLIGDSGMIDIHYRDTSWITVIRDTVSRWISKDIKPSYVILPGFQIDQSGTAFTVSASKSNGIGFLIGYHPKKNNVVFGANIPFYIFAMPKNRRTSGIQADKQD